MNSYRVIGISFLILVCAPAYADLVLPPSVTVEATGPGGAVVAFDVRVAGAVDIGDGRLSETVTCTPASLTLFPIGTTIVSCTGSEGSTGSFPVKVQDTTGPALTLPESFSVVTTTASPVTYSASAQDLVAGSVPIACSPASGSTFPLGTTTVSCSAVDSQGNSTAGSFTVTLAAAPPPPGPNPFDMTVEATGPSGAGALFRAGTGEDDLGRTGTGCSPPSGSIFPLGTTTVHCPAATFTVTVVDTTAPALSLPSPVSVTTSVPAAVTYSATATDLVDGAVGVTCTPPSGSTFALGTTTVSCSATDAHGNTATGSFTVELAPTPPPPSNPQDVVAEATSPAGAAVVFDIGFDSGGRSVVCSPPSGSTFPLGETVVQCNNGTTFKVTVLDTTPPNLSLPASQILEATSAAGALATFTATASDLVSGSVAVGCAPASGSTFPLGTTAVSCTASDAAGNAASGQFFIIVVDTTPPQITSITASPNSIWPPNHKLVDVTLSVVATDSVDSSPVIRIFTIVCNEPIEPGDTVITGPLTAQLRADRDAHGTGRIYTIGVEAIDAAGNRSTATVTVTVPRDQSAKRRSTG